MSPLDPRAPPNCRPGVTGLCTDINTDAIGLMVNLVVPLRARVARKWHPYGTAGLGSIHAWSDSSPTEAGVPIDPHRSQDDFAFNVGGGVSYPLRRTLALRADLRYFRALADTNAPMGVYFKDYGYWRVTVGLTFGSRR